TATGLAIVVPVFVPTLSGTFFGGGNGNANGNGDAVSISNPMIDLKRDLTQGPDTLQVDHRVGDRDRVPVAVAVAVTAAEERAGQGRDEHRDHDGQSGGGEPDLA